MWFLPSYNRPEKCKEVIDQINATGISTPGILFVNGAEKLSEYEKITLPKDWKMEISQENIGVCAAMNSHFKAYPDEKFYGLICDDEYVYSSGWDKKLIMAAGKTRISHGNDGWQSKNRIHMYATYGGDIIRKCGWWALPGLWHWYFDNTWENIANDFRFTRFIPEINCEHKHYIANKSEKDETYVAGESKKEQDMQIFLNWFNLEYPKLKAELSKTFRCYVN